MIFSSSTQNAQCNIQCDPFSGANMNSYMLYVLTLLRYKPYNSNQLNLISQGHTMSNPSCIGSHQLAQRDVLNSWSPMYTLSTFPHQFAVYTLAYRQMFQFCSSGNSILVENGIFSNIGAYQSRFGSLKWVVHVYGVKTIFWNQT